MAPRTSDRHTDSPTDGLLMSAVRQGDSQPFETLYRRHLGLALAVARTYAHNDDDAEDLVAEAFTRVLGTLRNGRGPRNSFLGYLLTVLRHVAVDRARRDKRLDIHPGSYRLDPPEEFVDLVELAQDRATLVHALALLRERWRRVLWYSEIQGLKPVRVAEKLRLNPNATAAVTMRAREALRQAYLQALVPPPAEPRCVFSRLRLGAMTRGAVSRRDEGKIVRHLADCARCSALAAELRSVNDRLRRGPKPRRAYGK